MRFLKTVIAVLFVITNLDLPSAKADGQKTEPTASNNKKSITNGIGIELKLIPAGEFMMGSSKSPEELAHLFGDKTNSFTDEYPQHKVHITKSFYLATTEVTQKQWRAVMGATPWKGKDFVKEGDDYPATYVSWDDAQEFIKKLNQKEGKTYRLPTEAEWEYACRARSQTVYSFGDSKSQLREYAWFNESARDIGEKYAHRVKLKRANDFGLFDMHGNVFEWCSDWYGEDHYKNSPVDDPRGPSGGSSRVLRSGSWNGLPQFIRSARRFGVEPDFSVCSIGFRVAKTVEQ